MIKAVLLDFDGTLVYKDILDVICETVHKGKASKQINEEFHQGKRKGLESLIDRINFLHGVTILQIKDKLSSNAYLIDGAEELINFLNQNKIISILSSGNILPVLQHYKNLLGITYIVGSKLQMKNDTIIGVSPSNFKDRAFKLNGVKKILNTLNIKTNETIAIGDSPADLGLFEFASKSIAINPKGGIEKNADYLISDLKAAIPIIQKLI